MSDLLPFESASEPPRSTPALDKVLADLRAELATAVRQRVLHLPPNPPLPDAQVAILFSGGLDCTTLALIADQVLGQDQKIDLINVAFENPRVMDARAGQSVSKGYQRVKLKKFKKPSKGYDSSAADGNPQSTQPAAIDGPPALAEPAKVRAAVDPYDVPDRKTGRDAWHELRQVRPGRTWQFVGEPFGTVPALERGFILLSFRTEVNVPFAKMLEHRQAVVDLMRCVRSVCRKY